MANTELQSLIAERDLRIEELEKALWASEKFRAEDARDVMGDMKMATCIQVNIATRELKDKLAACEKGRDELSANIVALDKVFRERTSMLTACQTREKQLREALQTEYDERGKFTSGEAYAALKLIRNLSPEVPVAEKRSEEVSYIDLLKQANEIVLGKSTYYTNSSG